MYKQKTVFLLALFVACLHPALYSQVGVSKTSGCAPMTVNFTAPAGSSNWNWNFGNGTSQSQNPSVVFNTPGTYNVTYSGTGGSPTSTTIPITVTSNNINSSFTFTIPPSHCAPMTVHFNGTSNVPTGNYNWSFGDGGQSNGASVNYAFTIGGIFTVTLSVVDPVSGCKGIVTNGPINVSTRPALNIIANPGLTACSAPFTTSFTGSTSSSGSPLGGGLTYSWNFGNSQTSTQATPGNITYNSTGTYYVKLKATDNNNCTDSTTEIVIVDQPTISATVPASICIRGQQPGSFPLFGISFSSNEPYTTWDMGDGTPLLNMPTSAGNFTYTNYSTPGLITIVGTASLGNCVATVTKTIFVEQITPQFTFTPPSYTCSPHMVATYINQSTMNCSSSLSYTWSASEWAEPGQTPGTYTNTSTNLTHTMEEGSLNPYSYYEKYVSTVILTMTSTPLGCHTGISHKFDSIWRPTAWFNTNKKEGCNPLTVKFVDSSYTDKQVFPILSYTWNNGASTPSIVPGTGPPPTNLAEFTYTAVGTYTPYMIIRTATGCVDTSYIDTIIVVNTPTVSATFPLNLSLCAGQVFTLNMHALPSPTVIQHWHAQSDDGMFSGCVADSSPVWMFTHPGVHSFTVSGYEHGCEAIAASGQTLMVTGPVATGRFRTNCNVNRYSVDFTSYLQQAQYATLDFGDGTTTMTLTGNPTGTVLSTVTHTYAARGDYKALLRGFNAVTNCTYLFDTMRVAIRDIQASFTLPTVLCSGGSLVFDASNSVDVLTGCHRGYNWIFNDTLRIQQTTVPTLTYVLNTPGDHTVTLVVKDANSCLAQSTQTFIIDTPTPTFSFAANPACIANMPLQIVNTTPQSPVATASFTWDFGSTPGTSTVVTTAVDTQTFTYFTNDTVQTYTVSLTALSKLYGCIGTSTQVLQVNNPPPAFIYPFNPGVCVNDIVTFTVDPEINTIDFNDGSALLTTTLGQVSHKYTAAGLYSPSVIFHDGAGCTSSFTCGIDVQAYPTAGFVFYHNYDSTHTSLTTFCDPAEITFSSTSISLDSLTYKWNLSSIANTVSNPTVHAVYSPGQYTISLKVSTSNNCASTYTSYFTVQGPTAAIVSDKKAICQGETIILHIKDSAQVAAWNWYFNNVLGSDTILSNAPHTSTISYTYSDFPTNGQGMINLLYFSPEYFCSNTSTLAISVNRVDAGFKRNAELAAPDSVHCLKITDQFNNTSTKNYSTTATGLDFTWDFGDGNTSAVVDPAYTYTAPGIYSVTLTVVDDLLGCKDITVKNMTVNPLPSGSISIPDSICQGRSFVLSSTSSSDAVTFQWQPSTGVVSPNLAVTNATATVSTTYSLMIGNAFDCTVTSNSEYVYIQPPALQVHWDTTIIIGQTVTLNTNQGSNFTYTWTPLSDLSCENCAYPVSSSTANAIYSVTVQDNMRCFDVVSTYSVFIDTQITLDVPTAFTPNGDGVNDVIYVDGWGIRKLNYFRIFNRWGEQLFESTDIKVGWDGIFKGVPQNMDNYVYQVSAEGYLKTVTATGIISKTGSFRLVR